MTIMSIVGRDEDHVISVSPTLTIAEVVQVLATHDIGAVLVMEAATLLGVLSERDIVRAMAAQPQGVRSLTARELMYAPPATISMDQTLSDAMRIMTQHHIRYLPAVQAGAVRGVVSIGDVVKAQLAEHAREVEVITAYVTGST